MATSDADGGDAAAKQAERPQATMQIDKRLEPLEEFRSRAEGWMKEVTAQVARLSSSFEQEDKKRQALEDRLADIEERIRSLLTLTELVSLDKNPFAGSSSGPAEEPASSRETADQKMPEPPPTHAEDQTTSSHQEMHEQQPVEEEAGVDPAQEETQADAQRPFPAAGRPGVEVIPVDPRSMGEPERVADDANAAEADAQPTDAEGPEAEDPKAQDPKAQDPKAQDPKAQDPKAQDPKAEGPGGPSGPGPGPEFEPLAVPLDAPGRDARQDQPEVAQETERPTSWSLPAPERSPPRPAHAHHPNDAQAETSSPAPTLTAGPSQPAAEGGSRQKTAQRLLVVAWADLLAPAAGMVDVKRFTDFYVEAQWVNEQTARLVGRLVEEIGPYVTSPKKPDVRGLHEATVRLLAEHDPELASFDRVDADEDDAADASEMPEDRQARLNAT